MEIRLFIALSVQWAVRSLISIGAGPRRAAKQDSRAIARLSCLIGNYETAFAASRITSSTTLGCDSIGTWLEATSVTLAFMRFAAKCSRSGWTVRSLVATMDQLGFVRHAMPPSYFCVNRSAAGAKWVDQTTPCSSADRSPAK